MNSAELLEIIKTGETSKVQFKESLPNAESMSREIVTMSNSLGGMILLGVKDRSGAVIGLSPEQIEYADRKVSEFADNIKPTVYLTTEVIKVMDDDSGKNILIVHVERSEERRVGKRGG